MSGLEVSWCALDARYCELKWPPRRKVHVPGMWTHIAARTAASEERDNLQGEPPHWRLTCAPCSSLESSGLTHARSRHRLHFVLLNGIELASRGHEFAAAWSECTDSTNKNECSSIHA